jgi:hypothetical protein
MIIISHRGNLNGYNKNLENNPGYILSAIKYGYHVMCDIWLIDNNIYFKSYILRKKSFITSKKCLNRSNLYHLKQR